jgi:hypothetical protein
MPPRINILTVASIGIFAFGLEPVVHEILGHAVACWLTGGKVILISSTAMQTASVSRLVPAAGPIANIIFGLAALALLRSITPRTIAASANAQLAGNAPMPDHAQPSAPAVARPDAPAVSDVKHIPLTCLFLYFFAFANLFLATGYILYSGLIRFGDFAAVIDGLRPAWLYRAALVVIGALGYRYGIAQAARFLASLPAHSLAASAASASSPPSTNAPSPPAPPLHSSTTQSSPSPPLPLPDARRIVHTACFAGGALFLLASALNPIAPTLILYDGLSGTIGLTLGFFLALTDLRQSQRATPHPSATQNSAAQNPAPHPSVISIPFNLPLTISAASFATLFLIFMGHGIRIP